MAKWFLRNNEPTQFPDKIEPNSSLKFQKQLDHYYRWEKIFFRALIVGSLTFTGILIYHLHYN